MSLSTGDGSVSMLQEERHRANVPGLTQRGKKRSYHHMGRNDQDDLTDEQSNASEKKRGLTTEQINFLETSFNMDLKLDPERKALIAEQLGIRPRQVAIWFQNRRARWKNKQLEQDYEALKAIYEAVVNEKESILKERDLVIERNKVLQAEVTRLTTLLRSMASGMSDSICTGSPETWQNKEQSSVKAELSSPNKSGVEQSEMQDSGQSIPTPSGTMNIVTTDLSVEESDSASRPDMESLSLESIFSSLPLMVQQLIVNGYSLEDAYCRFLGWEDQVGGFAWFE